MNVGRRWFPIDINSTWQAAYERILAAVSGAVGKAWPRSKILSHNWLLCVIPFNGYSPSSVFNMIKDINTPSMFYLNVHAWVKLNESNT